MMLDTVQTLYPAIGVPVVPRHVAIIMDGNGRWAQARGLPRAQGHRRGVDAVRRAVRAAGEIGVEVLTLYSFSSENWSRPAEEVSDLMGLLKLFIRRDLADLHKENVRVRVIGGRDDLPDDIRPLIEEAEELTRNNTAQTLVIAFNYGARDEMGRALRRIARSVASGETDANAVCQETLAQHLDTAEWGDPDIIIRTGGEKRLSNFLMFQAAYSELFFIDTYWPDFERSDLERIVGEFGCRDRRFGGLKQVANG